MGPPLEKILGAPLSTHKEARHHAPAPERGGGGGGGGSLPNPMSMQPRHTEMRYALHIVMGGSGVARIFSRRGPNFMGAPRYPHQKTENSSDLAHYLLEGAQFDELKKEK